MKKLLMLMLFAVTILTACQAGDANTVTLTAQDAGKTIDIKKGQMLQVTLQGNPTTGFNWESTLTDDQVLKQNGEPAFQADSNADGSGGMVTLRFDAVAPGEVDLNLVYRRNWEKDVAPIGTYSVKVVVNE